MKKIGVILMIIMMTGALFTGCGEKAEPSVSGNVNSKIDAKKMADYLVENTTFTDDMSPVDMEIFLSLYNLDESVVKDASLYASTGATAEEVAVITATDKTGMELIRKSCQQRVEAQKQAFENYVPEELTKLETPVMKQVGDAFVLVVCNDSDKAEELIDNYTNTEV
ncbi:DUF4358 domain-containing protein [Clostridium aminobutyricum]|uniref:DUF4358 domain-containing protein n=1 Tax=Clostridium aminobutyricum TaxID=33953 RepID=A0A939DB75_CLOAM|nr:DUF4358 domain-containing protein [Clostridium aminobutyricum]MBN7774540.1 DUF4358 domain-containing protein [Clostridium aminobutyricum]